MLKAVCASSLLLLSTGLVTVSAAPKDGQIRLTGPNPNNSNNHQVDPAILAALAKYLDPVDAYVSLQREAAEKLSQPRLLHVNGETHPQWLTEGDKLRLARKGKKFMDITEHDGFYKKQVGALAGKAHLPELTHQSLVKPLFSKISKQNMFDVVERLSSFYSRDYTSVHGEESAKWLYHHIAEIIKNAPFHTHISLEVFTHDWLQPSLIARFEPKVRNASLPLTILGAHLDSRNQEFPLLPAPGADDDGSGTASNLEAFRVLAESGIIPLNGPVEFHWYSAEEGGMLGSQDVARFKKESGANIGAMVEFDMTAFVARNSTDAITFVETEADGPLTNWIVGLANEYISIPAKLQRLPYGLGSDYMSYTRLGYPSTIGTEGNPAAGGMLGDLDPYIHTVNDIIDIGDEAGVFSFDHMARFSEVALAFAIEQAGWDNKWR